MSSISHIPREISSLAMSQLSDRVSAAGLCSGTGDDRWHPDVEPSGERGRAEYEAHARLVCAGCPAKTECLILALRTESRPYAKSHGIWGGTAPWERERMLRRIKRRAAAATRHAETQVTGVSA